MKGTVARKIWSDLLPILKPSDLAFISNSAEQTARLGTRLGQLLSKGDLICLSGPLGAGKTALAAGVGKGWGTPDLVNSPTFVFVHEYHRPAEAVRLFHVDCYRLSSLEDAESIGIEEILAGDDTVLIEWPERIQPLLPPDRLWIQMDLLDEAGTKRQLTFRASGTRYETLLDAFRRSAFGV